MRADFTRSKRLQQIDVRTLVTLAGAALLGLAGATAIWWYNAKPVAQTSTHSITGAQQQAAAQVPRTKVQQAAAQSLADIMHLPSPFARSAALHTLVLDADGPRLLALIDAANRLDQALERHANLRTLLQRYLELEPEAAMHKARSFETPGQPIFTVTLYMAWLRIDAQAATAYLQDRPPQERMMIAASLQSLGHGSLNRELASADAALLDSAGDKLSQLARSDPLQAWADAAQLKDLRQQQQLQRAIIQTWVRQDPQRALQAIANLPKHRRFQLETFAINLWANTDAEAALLWLQQRPADSKQSHLLQMVVAQVARSELDRALTIANALPDKQRTATIDSTLLQISQRDPELALEQLQRSGIDLSTSKAYANILAGGRIYTHLEALGLAEQLGEAALRNLARPLFSRWAASDPAAAALQLERIPEPTLRQRVQRQVLHQWALKDAEAAANWIESQPQDQRDRLRVQLVGALGNVDPMLARSHVGKIQDGEQYDRAAVRLLAQLRHDPNEVERVLESLRTESGKRNAQQIMQQLQDHGSSRGFYPGIYPGMVEQVRPASGAVLLQNRP